VHEFVKKREAHREALDISALLYGIMPLLDLQAQSAHVQVHCVIAENLPAVLADKILIEQVMLNLSRNAMEAMHNQPQEHRQLNICVTLEATPDDQNAEHPATVQQLEISRQVQPKPKILIQVIDRGTGISEAIAAHLFTPFLDQEHRHGYGSEYLSQCHRVSWRPAGI